MRRNTVIIALLSTALLIGAAVLISRAIFTDTPDQPAPHATSTDDETPRTPPRVVENAPPEEATIALTVTQPGGLERLDGERWVALEPGAELNEDDRIRASGQSTAVLSTSNGSRIELVDEVEVSVEVLTRSLTELELYRGRLRADLDDDAGLELRVRASGATAEARAGAFVIYSDGAGMVAVASETAQVRLEAQEREVVVAAGQQAIVPPEEAPSEPEQIPEEVFLRVAWPQRRAQRERHLVVRGAVAPGSEVRIGDQRAEVDREGHFEARVQLDAGPNRVKVRTRDILGRERVEESPPVIVKNRPPRLEVISGGQWER